MNLSKTKIMLNSFAGSEEDILLERIPFEKINSYAYLGKLAKISIGW